MFLDPLRQLQALVISRKSLCQQKNQQQKQPICGYKVATTSSLVGGVAQRLGRRSLAGGLFLTYARSMAGK